MEPMSNGHAPHSTSTSDSSSSASALSTFLSSLTAPFRSHPSPKSTYGSHPRPATAKKRKFYGKQRNGDLRNGNAHSIYHQLDVPSVNDENNNQTKTDQPGNSVTIDLPFATSPGDDTDKYVVTLEHFLWILLATLCYFAWFIFVAGISIVHVIIYLVVLSLYLLSDRTRRFALAALIYLTYLLFYDALHLVPNYTVSNVHIMDVYLIEKKLFGVYKNGHLMTLNEYFRKHHTPVLDVLSGICYLNW